MTENEPAIASMNIGGGRRLTAADDVLVVEARSAGSTWTRVRVIPYEDIRALYRFEATNWRALSLLVTLWIALLAALLLAAGLHGWAPMATAATTGGATLLALLVAVVQARAAPARSLKIEAFSATLVVPDRSPQFCAYLAAQVRHRAAAPARSAQPGASSANNERMTAVAEESELP